MEVMNEMFEFVTDEEVLKELEHIFDRRSYVDTDENMAKKRRRKRTDAEVK